jgi:hypothetical protein
VTIRRAARIPGDPAGGPQAHQAHEITAARFRAFACVPVPGGRIGEGWTTPTRLAAERRKRESGGGSRPVDGASAGALLDSADLVVSLS